jgi:hypothetical protein
MTERQVLPDLRATVSSAQGWEYRSYETDRPQEAVTDFLDRYGRDGWELVSAVYIGGRAQHEFQELETPTMFYFKKPI